MKVSVIIPVYNVERYLARCLDSVLAAVGRLTALNPQYEAEIICVDDGSTDGSAGILECYRGSFDAPASTFSVLRKEHEGPGPARNMALDRMSGDYVMFVDSDDWIVDDALVKFVQVAESSRASLVVSSAFFRSVNGVVPTRPDISRAGVRWRMRKTSWIVGRKVQYCVWNKLYRAELLRTRRFPATVFEDMPIATGIFGAVGEFAVIEEPLYVYCANAGATSLVRSSFSDRKLQDSLTVVRMTLDQATGTKAFPFALGQAADGHSSTIGQVYKAHDPALTAKFLAAHDELVLQYPELPRRLRLKARFRLWRLRRTGVQRHVVSDFLKIAVDPDELSAVIAKATGCRYRLTALQVKCTCPVFRGEAEGLPPVCVKLDDENEWRRTANLLRELRGCPLFSHMPYDGLIEYHGRAVSIFEWKDTVIVRPENMTERQAESFLNGCRELAYAFGKIKDDAAVCVPPVDPEKLYGTVRDYAARHPLARRFLADLLAIPVAERTYGKRVLPIIHGDFHSRNFRFEGDRMAHVFDFGLVSHGLACMDLANAFLERYSCLNLAGAARRRLDRIASFVLSKAPWPREDFVIACNIVRLQFAARRIAKHPNSAWVALDILRRDRKIREFLMCLG